MKNHMGIELSNKEELNPYGLSLVFLGEPSASAWRVKNQYVLLCAIRVSMEESLCTSMDELMTSCIAQSLILRETETQKQS